MLRTGIFIIGLVLSKYENQPITIIVDACKSYKYSDASGIMNHIDQLKSYDIESNESEFIIKSDQSRFVIKGLVI